MADEEKDKPVEPEKPAAADAGAGDKFKTQPLSDLPTDAQPKSEADKPEEPKPPVEKPAALAAETKPAGADAKAPADKPAPKPAAKAPPKKPAEVETVAIPDDAL